MDENGPRMVQTPWVTEPVTFEEAAEMGTQKVIDEHSTVGLVVTTDGSFPDLARAEFVPAEERVVSELRQLNKPFLILLNSSQPTSPDTLLLRDELESKYGVAVLPVNCARMTEEDIATILKEALYEFPVREANVALPTWVTVLDNKHWLRVKLEEAVAEGVKLVRRLRDIDDLILELSLCDAVQEVLLQNMDLAKGVASVEVTAPEHLYYDALSEAAG
ncbi:MAG: Stage IV sporulation protein A [Firmicutes bacterium]|nr:Stage IV sporulation protein A [Bacillota bacterium]